MNIRFKNNAHIFNKHNMNGDGVPYISCDMLDELGVPNLYSTRFASFDASSGIGESGLRLAYMSDESWDEAKPVIYNNMEAIISQLGGSMDMQCVTMQKHTNIVRTVTRDELGPSQMETRNLPTDGLITDIPNAVLVAYGADCPPVYIVDPARRAIGLVHAGWKGTLGKIPAVAVEKMQKEFGCKPENMYACIGIGICEECYEMGDEVFDAFAKEWSLQDAELILKRYPIDNCVANGGADIPVSANSNAKLSSTAGTNAGGKYHLNLMEANKLTLLRAGIPEQNIAVTNICTRCNSDIFYSYRAKKMENEQVAILINKWDD